MYRFILSFLMVFSISVVQAQTSLADDMRLAEQGDMESQYRLGSHYLAGKHLPQDYNEAFHWYEKAAEQGHKVAQYNLAWMYDRGEGVKPNHKEALYWFERAAYSGMVQAQHQVSKRYYHSKGTSQNLILAYAWIYIAVDQDSISEPDRAHYEADKTHLENLLSPKQIAQAQDIALEIWNNMNQ